MAAEPGWAARWDKAYAQGDITCSWFQAAPEMSLRMLDSAGVTPADSVIDVGTKVVIPHPVAMAVA